MKFAFFTLGCKTNQYETQAMEQLFRSSGHEIGQFDEPCDGYIVNTCSVTMVADKKNRAVIRRCRKENPNAVIGVCGCYSQHAPDAVRKLGIDVLGGSAGREEFVEMMIRAAQEKVHLEKLDEALRRRAFEILPAGGLEGRTRAMLKVQDGCVNFCSYCIIPYTRGPVRSAPIDLLTAQARELAARGYREIVLTGIEIAGWGMDLPGKPPMTDMVSAICEAVPDLRIRLGSLEPRVVTEEFCKKMALYPNLCPQFHLSMQSGCDTVLARMKRKYNTARYFESLRLLREYFPECAITTDMIVAFPGETEEEYQESLAFIEKCSFSDMHIFPYSRRPGTPADKMPGQHDNATKELRSREAIKIAQRMNRAYRENLVGSTQPVLFEETEGAFDVGHAPNYVKIYVSATGRHNEIAPVRILGLHEDGLLGEVEG